MSEATPAEEVSVEGRLRVAILVPEDQALHSVAPGTTVREALALMAEHDYSQVPVIAPAGVVGVFSYRSLAAQLGAVRPQDDPMTVPVEEFLEDLRFVHSQDEIGEILRYVEQDGAVLVGDRTHLLALVTSTDMIAALWEATRPFVLIQDIELAIRHLVHVACSGEGSIEECLNRAFTDREKAPQSVEQLSMGQFEGLILEGRNFGTYFKKTFGNNRDQIRAHLKSATDIRNAVFHFRGEASAEQLDQLMQIKTWLRRRVMIAGQLP